MNAEYYRGLVRVYKLSLGELIYLITFYDDWWKHRELGKDAYFADVLGREGLELRAERVMEIFLTERDRRLLMRLAEGATMTEIADDWGTSPQRAGQLMKMVFAKLRKTEVKRHLRISYLEMWEKLPERLYPILDKHGVRNFCQLLNMKPAEVARLTGPGYFAVTMDRLLESERYVLNLSVDDMLALLLLNGRAYAKARWVWELRGDSRLVKLRELEEDFGLLAVEARGCWASGTEKIEVLQLPRRTENALKRAGVTTLKELDACSEKQLARVRGLGSVGVRDIKAKLEQYVKEHS